MSKISDILNNRPSHIWSVNSNQSVYDAIELMANQGIGAVLVIDDDCLAGILSERDYARKVILDNRSSKDTLVSKIMTKEVFTVTSNETIGDCMSLMIENDFRHLPVVEDDKVIGMISIGDMVREVIREQQFTIEQLEQYITG